MYTSPTSTVNALARNPLFVSAGVYACGIWLQLCLFTDLSIPFFVVAALLGTSIFSNRFRTASVIALFVFCGSLAAWAENYQSASPPIGRLYDQGWIASGDPVIVEGALTDHPQATVDGAILQVNAAAVRYKKETIKTYGIIRVFVALRSKESAGYCSSLKLRAGNRVRISLRLMREERYQNPGTLNMIDSLRWRGLEASGGAKSCFLISVIGRETSLVSRVYEFREWVTQKILNTHDRRTAGIVLASLVGNKNFLTYESGEIFRENGTFHVLIISGLHITLIGGLILLLVRRVSASRITQFVIANTLLWSYALFVGLQLPVLRAAVMFTVFLLAHSLFRATSSLNSLSAAVFAILIWRPSDLLNPSFQFTCISSFAIVCFAIPLIVKLRSVGGWMPGPDKPFPPAVRRPLRVFAEALYWSEKRWNEYRSRQTWECGIDKTGAGLALSDTLVQRLMRNAFEIAFVSLTVQLFLLPLLVFRFHRISAASILSNIFAGAAVAMQNAAAIVTILLDTIDNQAAKAFASSASAVTDSALYIQNTIATGLFASIRIPVYSGTASSIYFFYFFPLLTVTVIALRWDPFQLSPRRRVNSHVATAVLFLLTLTAAIIILHPYSAPPANGRLRVDFLDVGQGDSALVTFPHGKTMLIDGGGQRNFGDEGVHEPDRAGIGERVVSEYLWERGYSRVDYLVSTHPDADHIKGLSDVLRNFDVERVFAGGMFDDVVEFEDLKAAAAKNKVQIQLLRAGMELSFEKARVRVLHPDKRSISAGNDDSVVLHISMGVRSFLFTGDIEAKAESSLLRQVIESTIVKVPHHGSRTSSTRDFVDNVRAEYAVIPVGKRSPYGHPHREIVERWMRSGARVIRVGYSGTLTISTDGSDLKVNGFLEP